jgi:ankyrin repeat protein
MVKLLLDNGAEASVNEKTNDGWTPLHIAAYYKDAAMVEMLVANGAAASVNKKTKNGWAPLHHAARYTDAAMVELLLEKGAADSVNEKNNDGWTPLHLAAYVGNIDVVKALIKNGADINAINQNKTPLALAQQQGKNDVVELLKAPAKLQELNQKKSVDVTNMLCDIGLGLAVLAVTKYTNNVYTAAASTLVCAAALDISSSFASNKELSLKHTAIYGLMSATAFGGSTLATDNKALQAIVTIAPDLALKAYNYLQHRAEAKAIELQLK